MSGNKKKKQCPYNEWVYCSDEECDACGWNSEGRTKPRKRRTCKHDTLKHSEKKERVAIRKKQNNNTTGYTGVYWNKNRKKWTAEIRHQGEKHFLGSFESLEDAVKARREAEKRLIKRKEM